LRDAGSSCSAVAGDRHDGVDQRWCADREALSGRPTDLPLVPEGIDYAPPEPVVLVHQVARQLGAGRDRGANTDAGHELALRRRERQGITLATTAAITAELTGAYSRFAEIMFA
jgi:hypothetical protein